MKKQKFKLGDTVRCRYTGFQGVAVARTEYINGCVQYSVAGRVGAENKLPEMGEPSIDEQSLELIKSVDDESDDDEEETGGPTRRINGRYY